MRRSAADAPRATVGSTDPNAERTTFRAGSTVGSVLPTDSGQAQHGPTVREKMGKLQRKVNSEGQRGKWYNAVLEHKPGFGLTR